MVVVVVVVVVAQAHCVCVRALHCSVISQEEGALTKKIKVTAELTARHVETKFMKEGARCLLFLVCKHPREGGEMLEERVLGEQERLLPLVTQLRKLGVDYKLVSAALFVARGCCCGFACFCLRLVFVCSPCGACGPSSSLSFAYLLMPGSSRGGAQLFSVGFMKAVSMGMPTSAFKQKPILLFPNLHLKSTVVM